jgi:O-succinylhomoserine sulfhydrylase
MSPFNAWVLSKSIETLDVEWKGIHLMHYSLHKSWKAMQKINSLRYPFLESHPQYEICKEADVQWWWYRMLRA